MAKTLRIARFSLRCTVLGPGTRGVIWVQGCERHCPGCVAPETWDLEGGEEISISDLANLFTAQKELEGLTFSGGEPFLQAEELACLIDACRKKRPDFSFMAFTGAAFEELLAKERRQDLELLARLDILVDGPYLKDEHENLLWRGSRNQRVWFLTPRYEAEWKPKLHEIGVHLELEIDHETVHCMGVPPKDFRQRFERMLLPEKKKELKQ